MLVRRKNTFKKKRPLTLNEAIAITMAIHMAGVGAIWYWPVAVSKIRAMLLASSNTAIKQPTAPYSDALERAFHTLREWTENEKQAEVSLKPQKQANKNKHAKR